MSLVKHIAGNALKSSFVYSDPAPGGVTVADAEAIVWVGGLCEDTGNYSMIYNHIEKLLNAIRGSGIQGAVTANGSWIAERNHLTNVTVSPGTGGVPASNGIQITCGALYRATPSASLTPFVTQAAETWLENVAKKAA